MASWSRREQNQAYQFLNRRIVSAILSGEPETTELPMRRFGLSITASAAVAVLVIAGFLVYGLLVPGGRRPAENSIILERETGATYIYRQGELHPVLNFTSARLILGQANPPVQTLSRAPLRDIPRGLPVGIPGVPDTLPDKSSLVGLPWSVCTAPRSPTSVVLATHVLVGTVPDGGTALPVNEGVLVTAGVSTDRYLVWHDHRLRVRDNAVIAALGWTGVRPAPVTPAFLDALPAGPDLTPLTIPGAGQPSPVVIAGSPTTVGQLVRAQNEFYVVLANGLAHVGELTAQLWSAAGQRITDASAQEIGRFLVDTSVEPTGLPAEVPTAHGIDDRFAMACAVYRGGTTLDQPVSVLSYARVAADMTLTDTAAPPVGTDGSPVADRVALPGGRGALAATLLPTGSAATGNVYVVTDQGLKYPLPPANTATVQSSLGFAGVHPVPIPSSILALIPTGPALDPSAAALFVAPDTVKATPSPSPA
ncbi:type VII secretion protein EccB [Rugosimonospora acidiphila]|uniref:Type VII secretion protein EccB n=1 Tax=Rugosimonospora acidiphila TaxID=556531 RepID=A0ABP9RQW2_9ACTN